ncbi:Structural maintenance of chromosomes protein 6 [Ascosphaera aggregata]|nr:Structural maintenance of chromosomes protein 6 [Ascosphaera aggregata]
MKLAAKSLTGSRKLLTSAKINRSIREAIKELDSSIEKLDRSIDGEKERLRELDNGRSTRLQQEIEEKQHLAKELSVQLRDAQETMRELREAVDKAQRAADEKKQPLSKQKNEVDQAEARLNHLKRYKNQQRSGFSARMPDLLRAIDREVGTFSMRPVGPLGNHVRLLKPKWSSILEQTFGGALSSFVVTSKHDMNILQKMMQRTQCPCPIFIASDTSPLNTSAHEPDPEYDTILRVLDIDNEIVKRQLIINNGIEQTLLIEDLEEASKVMFDRQRPRNVKRCFAIDRHNPRRGYALTYNRSGGPGQSPIAAFQGQTRMKTDHESQIRIQQEMVNTLRNELRQLDDERRATVMHVKKCQEAVHRQQREINNLRIKHQSTEDRISELQDEVANDAVRAGRLNQLKENRQNNLDEQETHKISLEDGIVALEEKTQKLRAVRGELAAKDAEKEVLSKQLMDCETAVSKHQSKRAHVLSSKNKLHERLAEYTAMKATKKHERETATQILETCNTKALGLSERLPVPEGETPDTLNQKREKLTADYNQAMRRMGLSPEEVAARTAATEAKLVRVEKQYRDFAKTHQKLTQALNDRFNRWKLFRSYITARAKIQFTYLLSERGFRGKTVVDHHNKLLDIKVEPDITTDGAGREAKTLSGGEKSFSQICLLLSLWEAMGSPIRCLDELYVDKKLLGLVDDETLTHSYSDVYMDSVNRRLSIELLMTAARRSVGKQFIFITPGSRADIRTAPDVKVNE